MKKRTKRILALVLAFAMMMQQTSIGSAAAEPGTEPTSEISVVQETETETQVQATEPDTGDPAEDAVETAAPTETELQTEAQTDQAAEAATEAVTEALTEAVTEPVSAEPETEPQTEKATEAQTEPATETTGTETETETGTEAETETETETEAGPTLLNASYGGVNVSVSAAPGVLKAGTTLQMEPVGKRQVYEALLPTLDENTEINKDKFLSYDITLMLDGQEVQPDGEVTVTFSNVPFAADENEEMIVAHLSDSGASDLPFRTVSTVMDAQTASGLSIKATHFSFFAVAVLKQRYDQMQSEYNDPNTSVDRKNQLKSWLDSGNWSGVGEQAEGLNSKYEAHSSNNLSYVDEKGEVHYIDPTAFDFHIFSEEAWLDAHTNGNIATNSLHGNSKNFGTSQAKEDGVEEFNYFGSSVEGLGEMLGEGRSKTVLGSSINVTVDDQEASLQIGTGSQKTDSKVAKYVYKESNKEKFINITEQLDDLSKYSSYAANQVTSSDSVNLNTDDKTINVTNTGGNQKGGIVYLNMTAAQLGNNGNEMVWNITVPDNTTLIINVDMTGASLNELQAVSMSVNGLSNGESIVRSSCNILWNFVQKTDANANTYTSYKSVKDSDDFAVVGNGNGFLGTILAPDAYIKYGALNGSVIARKTKQNGKESHNWSFTGASASITLTKKLIGSAVSESNPKIFYFALFSDPQGQTRVSNQYIKSVTFTDNGTKTVEFAGLKANTTYYIFETDSKGNPITPYGYTVTGQGTKVEITPQDLNKSATITNKGTEQVFGALKITKKVAMANGSAVGSLMDGEYEFEITGPIDDPATQSVTRRVKITISGGQANTATVGSLKPGKYTVTELRTEDGVTVTPAKEVTVDVEKNSEAEPYTNVEFTNTLGTGKLTVTKRLRYNGAIDKAQEDLTFYVALFSDAAGTERVSNAKPVTVKKGASSGSVVFDGLEVGKTYYVFETYANGTKVGTGYEYTVKYEGQVVAITRQDLNQTAVVVNNKEETGSIKVTKNVQYNGEADKVTKDFYVALFEDAAGKNRIADIKKISLKNESTKTVEYTGLQVGKTYYVFETDKDGNPVDEGFEYVVTGSGVPVTISRNNLNRKATITNNELQEGSLVVTKKVLYNGAPDEVTEDFYVALFEDADGQKMIEKTQRTISLKNESTKSVTYTGLEVGKTYYVFETDKDGKPVGEGFGYEVTGSKRAVTIERGTLNKAVTITNNKVETGSLTVTKNVQHNGAVDKVTADFYVALFTDAAGKHMIEDTIKTISLQNDSTSSVTYTGLEVGKTYYVFETDKAGNPVGEGFGYKVAGNGTAVAISKGHLDGTATITNNRVDTEIQFEGQKSYVGRDLAEGAFTFTVTEVDKDGKVLSTKEVSNDADGNILYPKFQYSEEGTHYYTIREVNDGQQGTQYDDASYDVTVNVTYNAATGKLEAKTEGADVKALNFTNTYDTSAKVELAGTKTLVGRTLKADEFSFELYEGSMLEGTYTSKADGTIDYADLTYTLADMLGADGKTYLAEKEISYTVKEKTPDKKDEGISYSNTELKFTVKLTYDAATGKLKATTEGADVKALNFTNTYDTDAKVELVGTKTLVGRTLKAGDFSFKVYDADGNEVAEGKNDADGQIKFGELSYTLDEMRDVDGEYAASKNITYTVKEVLPEDLKADADGKYVKDGLIYDSTEKKVTVTLTYDKEKGELKAEVAKASQPIAFTNTYAASGKLSLEAVKTMADPDVELGTYTFEVKDADGKVIATATNDGSSIKFTDIVEYTVEDAGKTFTYTVSEKVGEDKTILYDDTVYTVTVTVTDNGDGTLKVNPVVEGDKDITFENDTTTVRFDKVDEDGGKLANAGLTVKDSAGTVVASWTTDGSVHELEGLLKTGETYTLEETAVPQGYAKAAPVTFTVDEKGQTLVGGVAKDIIEMVDRELHFHVNKTDMGTGEEVDGAVIEVVDENGNVVDSWTSKKGETHDFGSKLEAGKTYTVKETVAPEGYDYTTDVEFTVGEDGTITTQMPHTTDSEGNETYLVEDEKIHLHMNKVETGTGEEVDGAVIEVTDSNGNVVDSWTSKAGETHDFGSKLKAGESYTMRESVTPDGYLVASNIDFTVNKDGTITIDAKSTTDEAGNTVYLMEDDRKPESHLGSIAVRKSLALDIMGDRQPIAGTNNAVFYVALFKDAERTQRVTGVLPITFNGKSSTSTVVFDKLGAGTYYVSETYEDGTPLDDGMIDGVVFYPEYPQDQMVTLETDSSYAETAIDNVFYELPPGFNYIGELQITKEVLKKAAGGTVESYIPPEGQNVFYAGIFYDPEFTVPFVDANGASLVQIVVDGSNSSTVVVEVPVYNEDGSMTATYYVTETDEFGNPLALGTPNEGVNGLKYTVTVEGAQVSLTEENTLASVVITNTFEEEEEKESESESETQTETETEKQTETTPETTTTKAAKTGDETNYWLYLFLLLMSAGTVAVVMEERRRANKNRK